MARDTRCGIAVSVLMAFEENLSYQYELTPFNTLMCICTYCGQSCKTLTLGFAVKQCRDGSSSAALPIKARFFLCFFKMAKNF